MYIQYSDEHVDETSKFCYEKNKIKIMIKYQANQMKKKILTTKDCLILPAYMCLSSL